MDVAKAREAAVRREPSGNGSYFTDDSSMGGGVPGSARMRGREAVLDAL